MTEHSLNTPENLRNALYLSRAARDIAEKELLQLRDELEQASRLVAKRDEQIRALRVALSSALPDAEGYARTHGGSQFSGKLIRIHCDLARAALAATED